MPMIKKPTKEALELDEYLNRLTEIELDTQSKAIFQLCETVRDSELFKNEREILESFLAWALNESLKYADKVIVTETTAQDAPEKGNL
jgi:hypothetical protein